MNRCSTSLERDRLPQGSPGTDQTGYPGASLPPRLRMVVRLAIAVASVLACVVPTQAQTTWPLTDLGTLGGTAADVSVAYGVNDRGDAVGESTTGDRTHAFLWTATGGMLDLGTLGGTASTARGVNEARQVVGWSQTALGETHAFLWTEAGGMVDLGTLGGATSEAVAINNAGQVVGWSEAGDGQRHGFVWTAASGMTDFATVVSATTELKDINDAGQVLGLRPRESPSPLPSNDGFFFWSAAGGAVSLSRPSVSSEIRAESLNNRGEVSGQYWVYTSYPGPVGDVVWNPLHAYPSSILGEGARTAAASISTISASEP